MSDTWTTRHHPTPEERAGWKRDDAMRRLLSIAVEDLPCEYGGDGTDPGCCERCAVIAEARSALVASSQEVGREDLLDALEREGWGLEPVDVPLIDDSDVAWVVYEYHMAAPHKREIAREATPQAAVRAALAADRAATRSAEPHQETCGECGQTYDPADLDQVAAHMMHRPVKTTGIQGVRVRSAEPGEG